MSAPLTIQSLKLYRSTNGAKPTIIQLSLSNQKTLEVRCSAFDTDELIIKTVANSLVEANQTAYWHPLSPGLVHALIKFRRAIIENEGNPVHIRKDMAGKEYELTPLEWNNFTKLRFHGLAVKMGEGMWQLHWRASDFLRGEIQLPQKVKTMNNEVIDHDEMLVSVDQVMHGDTYWDTIRTIERERVPLTPKTQVVLL